MQAAFLFSIVTLIWGSTWLAITFQLGEVDPTLSVLLRYGLAAFVLASWALMKRISLRVPLVLHLRMALTGVALYWLNYSFIYRAEQLLISAIVALMACMMIYMNMLLRKMLFGKPIHLKVVVGGAIGLVGLLLVFWPEFAQITDSGTLWLGIAMVICANSFASLGNVLSENVMERGVKVLPMNFWAMSYAVVGMLIYMLVSDASWQLTSSYSYWASLLYLSLFGTVVAFGAYMQLMQLVGSDRSIFVVLLFPLVALCFSSLFENYQWSPLAILGVVVILVGNAIALLNRRSAKT